MELNRAIRSILAKRGISSEEDIREFLSDKPRRIYDPFLLLNMDAGVDLVLSTIEAGGRICVYGDYDADGVTAVSLLMDVLRALGTNPTYYIPSRFDEGYGLNAPALDRIKAAGCSLVITVDLGCTSVEEVRHAREIGLDILVTDHHQLRDERPDCLLIDPAQKECPYPFKYLAGVGVAFKLAQALAGTAGLPRQVLTRNLDLVGIGTIGDIVPLVDENRSLAKYGLRTIRLSRRPGLCRLIAKVGLEQRRIASEQVSFVIVPHINAAGRMGDAALAARLLQTGDEARADEYAARLIESNGRRRAEQQDIYESCLDIIEAKYQGDHFFMIELNQAHEGVIGIAAGKIKERFRLPVVIAADLHDGTFKGTGRSVEGIDLFEILNRHAGLFERFGGHAMACGFTIRAGRLAELRAALREGVEEALDADPGLLDRRAAAEEALEASDADEDFCRQQELLEPFGRDNPKPVVSLMIRPGDIARMGSRDQYLRARAYLDDGRELRLVDFRNADGSERELRAAMTEGRRAECIGNLEEQEWKGRRYLQMTITDVERVKNG